MDKLTDIPVHKEEQGKAHCFAKQMAVQMCGIIVVINPRLNMFVTSCVSHRLCLNCFLSISSTLTLIMLYIMLMEVPLAGGIKLKISFI